MSSIIGHSLTALSIYSLEKSQPKHFSLQNLAWLSWLVFLAISPDLDYVMPIFHPSNHDNLRITHSIPFGLILPLLTAFALVGTGLRGSTLGVRILQAVAASLSHLILDLLVGVTALPLLWPINSSVLALPFGVLPSAGRIQLSNFYFYHNLFIELGVLAPLYYSLYLLRHMNTLTHQYRVIILASWFCTIGFMYWAYSLSR